MKEPKWIAEDFVLAVHEQLLFEYGGAPGVRDEPLLQSALARPKNLFLYEKPDIFELGAAYASGIIRNHPFIDGNKRTGFVAAAVFLERNGYQLNAAEADATLTTLALAAKEINERDFAGWLHDNSARVVPRNRRT